MRRNMCLGAVTTELREAGIDYQVERGRHLRVRFELNGRSIACTVAVSSSDWRAHRNARSNVRRLLRQAATDGAET